MLESADDAELFVVVKKIYDLSNINALHLRMLLSVKGKYPARSSPTTPEGTEVRETSHSGRIWCLVFICQLRAFIHSLSFLYAESVRGSSWEQLKTANTLDYGRDPTWYFGSLWNLSFTARSSRSRTNSSIDRVGFASSRKPTYLPPPCVQLQHSVRSLICNTTCDSVFSRKTLANRLDVIDVLLNEGLC